MMTEDNSLSLPLPDALAQAGQAANQAAERHRFADYRLRRAEQTLRRQQADLALFAAFLLELKVHTGDLWDDPDAWHGVTWGLVEAFVKWQLQQGYSVSTVNVRLSTVKTYARLAMQSGALSPQEYAMLRSVQGYSQAEGRRVDQRRPQKRRGLKKAAPVALTPEQAQALKARPDTPQGRRDRLLMCLLLDHGLRVGEVAALAVEELDLERGLLRFYRPKVNKEQVHRLSPDTLQAAQACARAGELLGQGLLLRRTRRGGTKDKEKLPTLAEAGMTERAITQRVRQLGKEIGVFGLSAHDCRHYWATSAARHGTDPFALQEAGGWSSLAMPRRYVQDNEIANENVKLE
jgi:integrase